MAMSQGRNHSKETTLVGRRHPDGALDTKSEISLRPWRKDRYLQREPGFRELPAGYSVIEMTDIYT